jgi:hypothetical protein
MISWLVNFQSSKLINPKHDLDNAPLFIYLFIFITISIARWSSINNSCTICLNLKIYEIMFHGLEDPWVTNKLPPLVD